MKELIKLEGCTGGDLWVITSDAQEGVWFSVGGKSGPPQPRIALLFSWLDARRLAEALVKADKERGK